MHQPCAGTLQLDQYSALNIQRWHLKGEQNAAQRIIFGGVKVTGFFFNP